MNIKNTYELRSVVQECTNLGRSVTRATKLCAMTSTALSIIIADIFSYIQKCVSFHMYGAQIAG